MNAKKDAKNAADELSGNISDAQTLLLAAEDQVQFYLSNKRLLGPYGDLLAHHAREIDNLLVLVRRFLDQMDRELDTVMDFLYGGETPAAALD